MTHLKNLKNHLFVSYINEHQKTHIYAKILSEVRNELEKFINKYQNMIYQKFLSRLFMTENNVFE